MDALPFWNAAHNAEGEEVAHYSIGKSYTMIGQHQNALLALEQALESFVDPLIGALFAFLAAVVAVKWMVSYLQRHSLAVFGWYRLAVAAFGVALVLGSAI